jgi:hypothetical protein
MSDDDLDEQIRRLNPVLSLADAGPLDDRDVAVLQRVRERVRIDSPRRALVPLVTWTRAVPVALAAVFVLVLALIVVPSMNADHAVALTPPPLKLTSTSESLGDVVERAKGLLEAEAQPTDTARRESHSLGWYLHLDQAASGERTAVIAPEVVDLVWNPDGSAHRLTVAGVPYLADGTNGAIDHSQAPEPGTVISDVTYPVGGFDPLVTEIPGNRAADVKALLAAHWNPIADSPSASDIIIGTTRVLSAWTLTDEQHAHILDMLLDAPGAVVAGTAVDRAGRDVTVIAADSTTNPDFQLNLLISNDTGRIVGAEEVRRKASDDLPAGAVVSYTLWNLN